MAGSGGKPKGFEFPMVLEICTSTKETIGDNGYKGIYKTLESNLKPLAKYVRKHKDLKCVDIVRVSLCDSNKISLHFVVKNIDILDAFHNCAKVNSDKSENILSRRIEDYAIENSLEEKAGFGPEVSLVIKTYMPRKKYMEGMKWFGEGDEDDEAHKRNTATLENKVNEPAAQGHNVGEKGETTVERSMLSTSVKETAKQYEANDKEEMPRSKQEQKATVTGSTKSEHYTDSNSRNTSRTDTLQRPFIRKTLVMYVPPIKDKFVQRVYIECEKLEALNKTMKWHSDALYELTVDLPCDLEGPIKYNYGVVYTYFSYFKQKEEAKFSYEHFLGKGQVQRDLWAEQVDDSLFYHISDILTHCSTSTKISEICIQIEELCRTKLSTTDRVKVLVHELSKRCIYGNKSKALFAVVLGNVFVQKRFIHEMEIVDTKIAARLLEGLRYLTLNELSTSCKSYMNDVCYSLCNIVYQKNFNAMSYMNECFPFYEEKDLLIIIQNTKDNRFTLENSKGNEDAKNLCKKLYSHYLSISSEVEATSPVANSALAKILRRLPLKRALLVYLILKKNDTANLSTNETNLQDMIYGCILTQIQSLLNNALKSVDFRSLLTVWESIASVPSLMDSVKKKFEEELMNMLQKLTAEGVNRVGDILEEFCNRFRFFDSADKRVGVLNVISKSHNPELHTLFMNLLLSGEFLEKIDYHLIADNIFKTWFDRALKIQSRNREKDKSGHDDVIYLFSCHSDLLSVSSVDKRSNLQKELEKMMVNELIKRDLKDILRKAECVEHSSKEKTYALTSYRRVVQQLLNKRKGGQHPEEILLSLCGTRNELRVNSRVTAEIVCSILDLYGELPHHEYGPDMFQTILEKAKFWKLLFAKTGTLKSIVEQNQHYRRANTCLSEMVKMFEKHEVQYNFVKLNSKQAVIAKELIVYGGISLTEINRLWKEADMCFREEKETLSKVKMVLETVNNKVNSDKTFDELPLLEGIRDLIKQVKLKENTLSKGKLMTKQVKQGLWNDIPRLPKICQFLESKVKSQVFWNVGITKVSETYIHWISISNLTIEDEPLDGLCLLFDGIILEDKGDMPIDDINEPTVKQDPIEHAITFLDTLVHTGSPLYKKAWDIIQEDQSLPMSTVAEMFSNADIPNELILAEDILNVPIDDGTKGALLLVSRVDDIKDTVDAMRCSLISFGIDIAEDKSFFDAVESFDRLLVDGGKQNTFNNVSENLQTVFKAAEGLSQPSIDILSSLGKSSALLEFLQAIVDEDIRNLIDAVEDISEQHVTESTVSGLIEIKRFLHPLLRPEFDKKGRNIFMTIEKQTMIHESSAKTLPSKIEECMGNIHNLKSLYNNVANRGEQTKETIKYIVDRGSFHFLIDKENCCCDVTASYRHLDKSKTSQSKVALSDLRSRALLLMNSERQNKGLKFSDELEKFVVYIDLSLEIANLAYSLHTSGHANYIYFEKAKKQTLLENLKDKISKDLFAWQRTLKVERSNHYLMNFVHGTQIQTLLKYLEKSEDNEKADTLLKYIHPKILSKNLKIKYLIVKEDSFHEMDDKERLTCLGKSLHNTYEGLQVFERFVDVQEKQQTRITDIVQNGKLFVAQLEESSLLVVKSMLTLFTNTTGKLPEANQVCFCTKETTLDELLLFLGRCLGAFHFYGIETLFCVANVEALPNEIQFHLVEALRNIKLEKDFLLAIICRGSKNHPFIDELNDNVMTVRLLSDETLRNLFLEECPNVYTVTSEIAGLGKTNRIYKMAHDHQMSIVSLHISGSVHKKALVERLQVLRLESYHVLHIDIGNVDNYIELDTFLFELIILRHVTAGTTMVSLPTLFIYIEITNTMKDILKDSLHTAMSFKRIRLRWNDFNDFILSREVQSPVQVVCHFFNCLEKGELDRRDLIFSGAKAVKSLGKGVCRQLLQKYISSSTDLSFSVVNILINVLADQLKKMSCSAFFRTSRISDMIGHKTEPNVRSTLIKALIEVSKEFSSRSVNACKSIQASTMDSKEENKDILKASDLVHSVTKRLEGMIRWEESNHLVYVFHNQNIQTISPMYRNRSEVPDHIRRLFEGQMKKELQDFKIMNQIELQMLLQKIARTNPMPLPKSKLMELSSSYALTPDNLLKMVLVMLRIKACVPVVVMGETGCGKTSLIRYLAAICEVPFDVLNIHAGVEETAIMSQVKISNTAAAKHLNLERWLFLDEINTCEHLGLISEIICHHKCLDILLSPNLIVMGACNPYKLRTAGAISTAGLQGKVKTDELSKLVYRVQPLPEMLVDYVWDFGSLSEKDESIYIARMVENVFRGNKDHHDLFTDLLSMSQQFVRLEENTSYSVSLRDVQRCKTLIQWFLHTLKYKTSRKHKMTVSLILEIDIKAMILSLAHCYHSRFYYQKNRLGYRQEMEVVFKMHGYDYSEDSIATFIKQEQNDILERMVLPPGTAKNTALQENIFVILVCILNKIPIFVVGKPGCSKSLAMQVIRSNLRGKDSADDFFKTLPQLYCVSFQGSESSTSDGIIKVFEKAEKYQKSNSHDDVLSVVILDEIGLAEVSRFNPLKVLHNLLEPNGNSRPNVAVVGISNWSLDASKMNRAVHLSRPEMDEEELYETGLSISDSFSKIEQKSLLNTGKNLTSFETKYIRDDLKSIAKSYTLYIQSLRFKNFHGLRDFYSLVKFIAKELSELDVVGIQKNKSDVMMTGIERNFGGLPSEKETLLTNFQINLKQLNSKQLPVVDLITANVKDEMARHLMLITTGESVLGLLEEKLCEIDRERKDVIFGSQFEEDLTDDYNYRILSRIILCMEQGIVLVLKDLENIYGSLYDMLNQNYTVIGKKKNCRVALGPYSNPICHVADSFRCIVLVDESKIDFTDPPFLNRFEKQYLRFSDIINDGHKEIIIEIERWIRSISEISGKHFSSVDTFPIYCEDIVPSLILKLEKNSFRYDFNPDILISKCKDELMWIIKPEVIVRLSESVDEEIRNESEQIKERYFNLPLHEGIAGLMKYELEHTLPENTIATVVFTNSNIHTKVLTEVTEFRTQIEKLGAFKSEKQLSLRMHQFWLESDAEVLFLQCSAVDDEIHIMLAKSIVEKYRLECFMKVTNPIKHVYLIIHLDRSKGSSKLVSQINFLTNWKLVMLDSIECPKTTLSEMCSSTLYETITRKRPLDDYIKEQLFWTFTRIGYTNQGRNVESIRKILDDMKHSQGFLHILDKNICSWIALNFPETYDTDWQVKVACDKESLQTSSSFVEALETHILSVIDIPLSKTIYKMESQSILDSYFIKDENTLHRREAWTKMIANEKIFSIEDVPTVSKNTPESYKCVSKDLGLKMPFSGMIFETIETTRDEFVNSLALLKGKCGLDVDEVLPMEIFNELLLHQESTILQKLPDISDYLYTSWENDYIDDFCNQLTYVTCSSFPKQRRVSFMKWAISQKIDLKSTDHSQLFIKLHTTVWAQSTLFCAELQLFETCREMFVDKKVVLMEALSKTVHKDSISDWKETALETSNVIPPSDLAYMSEINDQFHYGNAIQYENEYQMQEITMGAECNLLDTGINDGFQCNKELTRGNLGEHSDLIIEHPNQDLELKHENSSTVHKTDLIIAQTLSDNTEIEGEKTNSGIDEDLTHQSEHCSMLEIEYVGVEDDNSIHTEETHDSTNEDKQMKEYLKFDAANDSKNQDVHIQSQTKETEETKSSLVTVTSKFETEVFMQHDTMCQVVSKSPVSDSSVHGIGLLTGASELFGSFDGEVEKDRNSEDVLVDLICKKMLPSINMFDTYHDLLSWQSKVNCVLTLASQVSQEPSSMHSLRFCNDVASGLLIPFNMDACLLQEVGIFLRKECVLDSEEMFSALTNIIIAAPPEAQLECQRLLSLFFLRCLFTDPNTNATTYLLDLIQDSKLPDNTCSLLKLTLQVALQFEKDENQNIFKDVINLKSKTFSDLSLHQQDGEDSCNEDSSSEENVESKFLEDLDNCLKQLYTKHSQESHFVVLLVDLLENIYTDQYIYNDNEDIQLFLNCHKILRESKFGLQYVAAIAFFKSFIASFVRALEDNSMKAGTVQAVNAVLQDEMKETINKTLRVFFFKAFGMKTVLNQINKFCSKHSEDLTFLNSSQLDERDTECCFESSPLCIQIPSKVKAINALFEESQNATHIKLQLSKIAEGARNDPDSMVLLYAIAMKQFYLPRFYLAIDDTRHSQGDLLLNEAIDKNLPKQAITFLKCLIGKQDFKVPEFMHGEGSKPLHFVINSFLTTLYSVLMAYAMQTDSSKMAVLSKCVLCPIDLKDRYLPGFPDSENTKSTFLAKKSKWPMYLTCSCSHRVAFCGDGLPCTVCKSELQSTPPFVEDHQCMPTKTGFVNRTKARDADFRVRQLSPVTVNILQIILKGGLIGSFALGNLELKSLEDLTEIPDKDVSKVLWDDIEDHWQNLAQQLNISACSVGLYLHTILRNTRDHLCTNLNQLTSEKDRLVWEEEFNHCIEYILTESLENMIRMDRRHMELQETSGNGVGSLIYEFDDIAGLTQEEKQNSLPTLFRMQGKPTFDNFFCELHLQRHRYPFLVLVLSHIDDLQLPIHLLNIVQWQIAAASNANYMFKKHDFLNMTVTEFITKCGDKQKKAMIRKRFDAFQGSWNVVRENKTIGKFQRIHGQTKMFECIILNDSSAIYKVLKALVDIQNDFLDEALGLATSCNAVRFLSRQTGVALIQCMQIVELKNENLIKFENEWEEMLKQRSQCNLSYGLGRKLCYDFYSIEKSLALNILLGKSYIILEKALPNIIFTDELYKNYVELVKELKMEVNQTPLPKDIAQSVKSRKENDPKMATDLLTHLGVIMTLLKKTKGDPDKPLVDYADEWKNILTRGLPHDLLPSPQSSIKLCHVVSLHELLEELNSEAIIDALEDEFRVKLDIDIENHFNEKVTKNMKLAELIVKAIRRFAHRCLSVREASVDQPLISYLCDESFWPDGIIVDRCIDIKEKWVPLVKLLPESIMVGHIHSVLTFIEEELERNRQGDMTMSKLATNCSYKPTPVNKTAVKKRTAQKSTNF